jgi:protein-disulfide isomerase
MRIALALGALGLVLAIQSVSATRKDVVEGNPASPVRVLIYEDLQCGDCARFETLLDQRILPKYGSRVAFIHRDFPLGKHDWALPAALAARWVYEQDPQLGIIFRRELLSQQNDITPRNLRNWLFEFAGRNRLDQKDIVDALNDTRLAALVDQDREAGMARGITSTPTVCVGGQMFVETIIYEDLARALDEALAK